MLDIDTVIAQHSSPPRRYIITPPFTSCPAALEVHLVPGHCERGGLVGFQDAVPIAVGQDSYISVFQEAVDNHSRRQVV